MTKSILIIGANYITYNILEYIHLYDFNISIYDYRILTKRDIYRLSWWLSDINIENKVASDVCVNIFKKCNNIPAKSLYKIELPDIIVFTTSHLLKDVDFMKFLEKCITANKKVIMAFNHHLYGFYSNIPKIKIDDINPQIQTLNNYVRINEQNNNNNTLVKDYLTYIYNCIKSTDPDKNPDIFYHSNMNSLFYPLATIISMYVVRDIMDRWIDTSIIIDWSLLRDDEVYNVKTEIDDYKYIFKTDFLHSLRSKQLLVYANDNVDVFNLLVKHLNNLGYLKYSKKQIYILDEFNSSDKYNNFKLVNKLTDNIIKKVDQSWCISDNANKKVIWDTYHIKYLKSSIYLNVYDELSKLDIINSIPNKTETYTESVYYRQDKQIINKCVDVNWRLECGIAMSMLQWIIDNLINSENGKFKKNMSSTITHNTTYGMNNKCKEYYNNMELDGLKVLTIPETFNTWTRIDVYEKGDVTDTIGGLLNHMSDEYNIIPYLILYDYKYTIFDKEEYDNINNKEKYLKKKIKKLIYEKTADRYDVMVLLNFKCRDDKGIDILIPPVYYHCNK
jgi:hypothetical protein